MYSGTHNIEQNLFRFQEHVTEKILNKLTLKNLNYLLFDILKINI